MTAMTNLESSSSCSENNKHRNVAVVVLGDLGHSPRMCNHALSLAKVGFNVSLVGYKGSQLPQEIRLNGNITPVYLSTVPKQFSKFPKLLFYFLKVLWQSLSLFFSLPLLIGPDFILLQNPPSVPALMVCWFYTLFHRGCKLIVDWHNYGYSILAMNLGPRHFLVKLSHKIESFFGPRVDASFCVSRAMKKDLMESWGVKKIRVLYDRPPEKFRPITNEEKHRLFLKLGEDFKDPQQLNSTMFTEEFARGRVNLRDDRPALLVSSTSWTEDEDFGILLKALDHYESTITHEDPSFYPRTLICVITGKGPLKEYYKKLISQRNWNYIRVITPWLEPEDYPLILASADLGVCLHTSSSGLDLPMKVVDMFGCALPVAALNYECLDELVKDGVNGKIFSSSRELGNILTEWFYGFPDETIIKYKKLSENLDDFQYLRWHDYWLHNANAIFSQ